MYLHGQTTGQLSRFRTLVYSYIASYKSSSKLRSDLIKYRNYNQALRLLGWLHDWMAKIYELCIGIPRVVTENYVPRPCITQLL